MPAMKIGGAHEVAVGATAERCMAIILDVPAYREWWPGVTESEVLSAGEQPEVRLVFDSHAPGIGAIELLARLEPQPPSRVGIELMGGRLKTLTGPGWTLTENGDGTCRVRYDITAEMDTGLPALHGEAVRGPREALPGDGAGRGAQARAES